MKFLKRIQLKRDARYIISSAILHHSSGYSQPGDLFGDLKIIGAITKGLSDLESRNNLEDKDREVIVEGIREELKSLFVPYSDLVGIVDFSKNFLDDALANESETSSTSHSAHSPTDYVITNTLNFVHLSTLLIDHQKLNKEMPKVGSCMFFAGAASYLSQKCDLGEEEQGRAVLTILKDYGLSHKNAMLFIDSIGELLSEPLGKEAFREGFAAIKAFAEENDDSASQRLRRLVDRWAEL